MTMTCRMMTMMIFEDTRHVQFGTRCIEILKDPSLTMILDSDFYPASLTVDPKDFPKQPWLRVILCNGSTQQPLLRSAAFGALRTFEVVGGTCQGTSLWTGALGAKVGCIQVSETCKINRQWWPLRNCHEKSKKKITTKIDRSKDPKRMGEVGILPLDFGIRFWDSWSFVCAGEQQCRPAQSCPRPHELLHKPNLRLHKDTKPEMGWNIVKPCESYFEIKLHYIIHP